MAKIVFRRTYSRTKNDGSKESWGDTVNRIVRGNTERFKVTSQEKEVLGKLLLSRKIMPGGRSLWICGTEHQSNFGESALINCWFWDASKYEHFVYAQDYLMLGGGVGMSVEQRFVSKLPSIKSGVTITHKATKDADYIVPDSREGWCELLHRVLEAYFKTGKSFTYSTICIRPYGEPIKGFGGTASGAFPLIQMVETISKILGVRENNNVRPIDAADVICAIGEMVVAGNVRRSAIILLGDPWDREYLRAKDWSRGNIPNYRAKANWSIVAHDPDDIHPDFWLTYENGEPYGIINRKNIQKFGRVGELRKDNAIGVNPCGEVPLQNGEGCNIGDVHMHNLDNEMDFHVGAKYLFRYMKRVAAGNFHNPLSAKSMGQNMRVGAGLTGCLRSPLFTPKILDNVYQSIQDEDRIISAELNVPLSIRTTTIKPAGTGSKVGDAEGYEGIHAGFSEYMIQRIRIASNDPLIPLLREAGHHIEPVINFDGTVDHGTQVVDFYQKAPAGYPVADKDWDTWKQLDILKMVQEKWSDNSVSVTVYYRKEEIPQLKKWVADNLKYIKSVSFLCHSDHGFKQAPKEAISKEDYERLSATIKPLDIDMIMGDNVLEGTECANGSCPIR